MQLDTASPPAPPSRPRRRRRLVVGALVLVLVAAVTAVVVAQNSSSDGWQLAFSDDFSGSTLSSDDWNVYNGRPDNEDYTIWRPSQVSVQNGLLTLTAQDQNGQWVAGGLANRAVSQKYGKYEVRFRIDKSDEVSYAILLWPTDEKWPPEIDFAEDQGGNRATTTSTVHYDSDDKQIERTVSGDFSQWHTVGVIWQPGSVSYTLDGKPWGSPVTTGVPDTSMELAIQLHGASCERHPGNCPSVGTPATTALQVDWLKIWSRG